MRKTTWALIFVLSAILFLGVLTLNASSKEQYAEKRTDIGNVSHRLDELLKNQSEILTRLEDIKKELEVVKIRASRR